jgi:hypothetical protein
MTHRHNNGSLISTLRVTGCQGDDVTYQRVDSHRSEVDCKVADSRVLARVIADEDCVPNDAEGGETTGDERRKDIINGNPKTTKRRVTNRVNSDRLGYLSAAKPTQTVMIQAKTWGIWGIQTETKAYLLVS